MITKDMALPYISYWLDDAMRERSRAEMPDDARLVGWQCGFEPLFVAVWSYLGIRLDDDEAIDLAVELLREKNWFSGESREPDYII